MTAPARRVRRWPAAVAAVVVLGWAVHGSGLRPPATGSAEGARALLRGLAAPNLSGELLRAVAEATARTVQISLTGLLLAGLAGLPLALLLARNLAAPAPLRAAGRAAAAAGRGVPDLLWALLFVAALGPGPAAGTLALAVHGAGMVAKLGAESLEAVPQARANLASVLLYQWECAVRASTVLGFVGAGGIGQELAVSLRLFRYGELATLMLAVLALIMLVDLVSRRVRRRLGAAA